MKGVTASLIEKCRKRDEISLSQFYRHCYPLMKGICMRYIYDKSRVSEVINSGFLKVVNGLDRFDHSKPIEPWVATIMIRTSLDEVRKIMRSTTSKTDLYEDMSVLNGQSLTYNLADLDFDAEELLSMLQGLPAKTKMVFNLFAIDGFSHKEISDTLNISTGTSKWHVSKARELLQKALLEHKKNKSDYEPSH